MKKRLNNKGFTLVEMAVTFAILAVVMLTVTLVLSTSSNTYGKITTDINLQYESQLAMSQLQEYTIDCSGYVAVNSDGSALYIFNPTGTDCEAFKFQKKSDTEELYFYKKTIQNFDPHSSGIFNFSDIPGELMSSYVRSFSADLSTSQDSLTVTSVTVTITFGAGNETYNGRQTFALRNQAGNISVPPG
jgi:prepilin-type N-terminal cleavage/methylation domain-containing protein